MKKSDFHSLLETKTKEKGQNKVSFAPEALFLLSVLCPRRQSLACALDATESRKGQKTDSVVESPSVERLCFASVALSLSVRSFVESKEKGFKREAKQMETQLTYNNKSRHLGIRFRERYTTREGLQAKVRRRKKREERGRKGN